MWRIAWKKITSLFLLFFFFFSITFRIPVELFIWASSYATNDDFYDLISLIVDEETYEETRPKLVQYSRDIQWKLENTRVVIIPTPSDASILDIASLNESLYYEWYKAHKDVSYESRLVGTVLVWKIPVPVVFQEEDSFRSILPYVDFEDKAFVFDHNEWKYNRNKNTRKDFQAEIWHGLISPNTWNLETDIQAIEDYFDKNHDFYSWQGVFDQEKRVLDGTDDNAKDDYEPHVFYYDQFRENEALQYQKYMGYEMYMQNIEDITYNRYSKELAEKVRDQVLWVQNIEISELIQNVDPDFDVSSLSSWPDVNSSSDIITRYVTDNSTKRYLEIFNSSTLGDMRKHVYNAWRYNEGWSKVSVDMPPFLISVLDEVSAEVIKNVNTALEDDITNLVTGGLSRDIVIPVSQEVVWRPNSYATAQPYYVTSPWEDGWSVLGTRPKSTQVIECSSSSMHYYYGTLAWDINDASQCSIYRWSNIWTWTLVEANRGYNINNTEADSNLCGLWMEYNEDLWKVTDGLDWFWGWNSPVNLSQWNTYQDFNLLGNDLKWGIRPVYDVLGMKKINDTSKISSPIDCFWEGVNIQTYREEPYVTNQRDETIYSCGVRFDLPLRQGDPITYYSSVPWGAPKGTTHESRFCASDNITTPTISNFDSFYKSGITPEYCSITQLYLGDDEISQVIDSSVYRETGWENGHLECIDVANRKYSFKKIPSHILHTSPTDEEFWAQVQSLFTPSLPIDSDRYIDFIWAKGWDASEGYGYERIDFPQLFRVAVGNEQEVSLESVAGRLEEYLDGISDQINGVIQSADPSSLSWQERSLYELLKTGAYPNNSVDLYESLASKPLEVFTSGNESKEISYLDTLVFAIYWKNLDTVSAKYKFIFEEYLENQFTGNEHSFHLPNSKKSYEMSYFAAPGDAANMYVKLDPDGKAIHPYGEILSQNLALSSTLQASNISSPDWSISWESPFACAPPEGVPIWEWIPAVTCWISDMLPPTIGIWASSCGNSEIFLSEQERAEYKACDGDYDKNGVNDCLEDKLKNWYITLQSDAGKYYYNTSGNLAAQIYDNDGEKAFFDNSHRIEFELVKVEVPRDSEREFDEENIQIIYDIDSDDFSTDAALELTQDYVTFSDTGVPAQRGNATSYFSTKSKDANIYFQAYIIESDVNEETVLYLESEFTKIEVRSDRMFLRNNVLDEFLEWRADNAVLASWDQNIFLIDSGVSSFDESINELILASEAKEKLLLSVSNFSEDGNALSINYPLSLLLERNGESIFSAEGISQSDLTEVYPLFSAREAWSYTVTLRDSLWLTTYKNIDVLPEEADSILPTLWTNVMETGSNISTHIFTVTDEYGNPATSEIYSVDIEIEGNWLKFQENGTKNISYQVLDGFKAFRLLSTDTVADNVLTFTLRDATWFILDETSRNIQTLDEIRLEIGNPSEVPQVWGDVYSYPLRLLDASWNLLSGLNSRAYLAMNSLYGKPEEAYVEIVWWEAELRFTSTELAWRDIPVEVQFEWGNDIYSQTIDIFPDEAIKIDIFVSDDQIEASLDSTTVLEASITDRYNNILFNDNETVITLEIPIQSADVISVEQNTQEVEAWTTQFIIKASDIPWRAYFKVVADPDISQNSFDIVGQRNFDLSELGIPSMTSSGALSEIWRSFYSDLWEWRWVSLFPTESDLVNSVAYGDASEEIQNQVRDFWNITNKQQVYGVNENAGSIETFFFWSDDDIADGSYNGIYSILAWAPYGDVSKENYLWWSLLFQRNNSALAVTSLLENPYIFHDVVSLGNSGDIALPPSNDITQDITSSLDVDQDGRIYMDIYNDVNTAYIGRLYYNLSSGAQISLNIDESTSFRSIERGTDRVIQNDFGKTVFEVLWTGSFVRKSGSSLRLNTRYSGKGLAVDIYSGDAKIWNMLIEGELEYNVTRNDRLLAWKLETLEDTIIVHLQSNMYDTRLVSSNSEDSYLKIYYRDPFASNNVTDSLYTTSHKSIESVSEEAGIGWQDSNTMLLEFAAGASVGEATKNFGSLSQINLGDPIASLKALDTTFHRSSDIKSFDSTFWVSLIDDEGLEDYKILDYNGDDILDILAIYSDGYMSLYEWDQLEWWFLKQWNLVFSVDRWNTQFIQTWDFGGDGYDDIFFVTNSWDPMIYSNIQKDFVRQDLREIFDISWGIVQVESYDMDNDSVDDIVVLGDSGDIHIFYGIAWWASLDFTKLKVGNSYWVTLSDTELKHGGAIYFEGIVQNSNAEVAGLSEGALEYLNNMQASVAWWTEEPSPDFIDENLMNQFLYVSVPYSQEQNLENINGITTQRQFLRSEYAQTQWIEVKKSFIDINEGNLLSGDRVYLDISLRNTGTEQVNDIEYVDNISRFFQFSDETFTILESWERVLKNRALWSFNIVINSIELNPGEEKIFRFELETLPFSYGDMQVGLFEEGELWDDPYGDIILKENGKNCWEVADIFRSSDVRIYTEGLTTPSCDSADIDIGNTHPNLVDANDDGVPDYLETLIDTEDSQAIQEYSQNALDALHIDSDDDGIPDSDDSMDRTNSATDFMWALSQIDEVAGEISEELDVLIEWLSCGFGGWSCIATPLNWAPLAPGNDPTLFGMPVGDGLRVNEGVPIFSALTWRQTMCGKVPCCLPSVFPATRQAFVPWPACWPSSAGGKLWTWSPTNFVRIFATPTLTGGFGTAVCFWWPALAAGNSNPIWVHPIVPWGNCIVTAQPIMSCEWGEWDPSVLGNPFVWGQRNFWVIHANCEGGTVNSSPASIEEAFVRDYIEYQNTGVEPEGFIERYRQVLQNISENGTGNYQFTGEPLISIGWQQEGAMGTQVSFDASALAGGNFEDVIQIENTRIAWFPGFLMDWVEAQLDEITSKLTNLPKVFVILPDFGGIMDSSFEDYVSGTREAFDKWVAEEQQQRDSFQAEGEALKAQKAGLDCNGNDELLCRSIDLRAWWTDLISSWKEYSSGIREVYDFLAKAPLINIETEVIPVNIPWIETSELKKFALDWRLTQKQWSDEIEAFADSIPTLENCNPYVWSEKNRCEAQVTLYTNALGELQTLLSTLEANIEILEEYQELPEEFSKILSKKEDWLYQILCNIEAIAEFTSWWIESNGQRFKAWVELYMLIKAILKSWQLFIDIFNSYEAECHECKNERQDLQNFLFSIIGSVLPSAPIIPFPKWPDIILDLHNVRAGMTVTMPDFQVNMRPITLPTLPNLSLPRIDFSASLALSGELNIDIPDLPTLPQFSLPELPDLPWLPTVELPNLPPPPQIPKLFGAMEWMMNIAKLITKVMCILKGSPFVPEWRAGDQIAFLTERNGYLPTDFINIQAPAFSYSSISAIQVQTFVNFEFEADFIVEAVRSILAPIDSMSANIVNMFDIWLGNIEIEQEIPANIDVDINPEWVNSEISFLPLDTNPEGINVIAGLLVWQAQKLLVHLHENSSVTLSNSDFIAYAWMEVSAESITSDPRTKELQNVWKNVFSYNDTGSDRFIHSLQEFNTEKFRAIGDILKEEMHYTSEEAERFQALFPAPSFITEISEKDEGLSSRVLWYNKVLDSYNSETLESAIALIDGKSSEQELRDDLVKDGVELMTQVRWGLESYKKWALYAAELNGWADVVWGTCSWTGDSYEYRYEGIYVLEDGRNYKLFDYTDPLRGDEEPYIVDLDGDGDDDVLYQIGHTLYFKENRKIEQSSQEHVSGPPLILNIGDNSMFNEDEYLEAVNGFREVSVSDGSVNLEFDKVSRSGRFQYSLSYNTIIDRYVDEDSSYLPQSVATHIVDGIPMKGSVTFENNGHFILNPHQASVVYVGAMRDITLRTPKLRNISDDLIDNTQVTLTAKRDLYAGAESFTIKYNWKGGEEEIVQVPAYESIVFNTPVDIIELSWDAYVALAEMEDIEGTDIIGFIGMPLLPDSSITYDGNTSILDESSHIDIRFEDESLRQIDFRDITSYTLYDLGRDYGDSYTMRLDMENDFYYGRLQTFSQDTFSTYSKQTLFAPQSESDLTAPQIGLGQKIRVPVYQEYDFDLTPYIYEDGGLSGISEVSLDMDLEVDSDGDGDLGNDIDNTNLSIRQTAAEIVLTFGPYDELFTREVSLAVTDNNDNTSRRNITLEVYAPNPIIDAVEENNIISWKINEVLTEEPVRLYRYRGWFIEKLQRSDGSDIILTDDSGNYNFETSRTSSWLVLKQAGTTIASIDEYTWKIDTLWALTDIEVLASNVDGSNSLYPELQILYAGKPVFRQFIKVPEGEIHLRSSFDDVSDMGLALRITDQERYNTFRIPLWTSYNPWSVSVYITSDDTKSPVMTVFRDGRVNIDNTRYRLEYRTVWEKFSFILMQKWTNTEIAELLYTLDASYILR